jgi:hypothetical protein
LRPDLRGYYNNRNTDPETGSVTKSFNDTELGAYAAEARILGVLLKHGDVGDNRRKRLLSEFKNVIDIGLEYDKKILRNTRLAIDRIKKNYPYDEIKFDLTGIDFEIVQTKIEFSPDDEIIQSFRNPDFFVLNRKRQNSRKNARKQIASEMRDLVKTQLQNRMMKLKKLAEFSRECFSRMDRVISVERVSSSEIEELYRLSQKLQRAVSKAMRDDFN